MTLLSKSDQEAVTAAINEVERQTDAELVTVLTAQSDDYSYIPCSGPASWHCCCRV
ncbi:hypothetical protein [Kineobactrum salinum]|uniref:hypothetical protein n=1 Tax=Kineobactrum salinum TaxID=2708301 RepID=UPI001E33120C|nr:hypothetical protein [Kineobactrum salinum]